MSEIKQNIKRGVFWTAIDKYSGQLIAIAISIVLARLLTPSEYGIVATASVFIGFISIFTSIGIGPAVIQRKDLSQYDLDVIFTFTVIIGLVCGIVTFGCSWLIADFYKNTILVPVMQVLAVNVFLGAVNMVPAAMMSKNLRFREMATRNLIFQVVFGAAGVIAAFYGAGVYALICPPIASSVCLFFYNNHFYPVKISLHFSFIPIKKIFSFSAYLFLFETFTFFSRNVDKFIISKYMSASALGYYEKSYRLMQLPLQNITSIVYPVLQPTLSPLQDNKPEIANKFTYIISIIALIGFPLSVIMHFCSEEIINVMFGNQWGPAVPAFAIMAFSIPFMLLNYPTGPIFLSCNASKAQFFTGVINTSVNLAGFIIAICFQKSIESIAWAWTITQVINLCNSYYSLYVRVMGVSLRPVFEACKKPVICAIVVTLFYLLYNEAMFQFEAFLSLIIKGLIGVCVSLACYVLIGAVRIEMMVMIIKKFTFKKKRHE